MIERHYDDEALISLIESRRATSDAHLTGCEPCNEKLESFQMIAEALHDADVWDTRPLRTEAVPATIATLRAFADRTADEDGAAVAILAELLAGSREEWMPRLAEHPEWRTAGVVRGLIEGIPHAINTMPPNAVEMTALATEIAEQLDVASQPSGTIARLTGAAWRERAYTLFYTGQFSAAEAALFTAERHLSYCVVNEYDLARVGSVKALVLRSFDRIGDSLMEAARSAGVFRNSGDTKRLSSALFIAAHVRIKNGEYREALNLLRDLERLPHGVFDDGNRARLCVNIAFCCRELGDTATAMNYYTIAGEMFAELDIPTEGARVRWNVADLLMSNGNLDEALSRLSVVAHDLSDLGMRSSAALARLSMAEIFLTRADFDRVEALCRELIHDFDASGLAYSNRALTALGLLRDAATAKRATPDLAKSVRHYIRRLPEEPQLLFAMPPE